jgi:endogenous inhibitor of DNA gyrase (YacG/DUF329 family)
MAVVACPTCQRPVEWSEASPFRPFCSERCRLLDLGAWMNGQRAIPGEELPLSNEDDSSPSDLPPRH